MKKKIRFYYHEDVEIMEHIEKQPFHQKSKWVREATRAKMEKDRKNVKVSVSKS